MKTLKYECEKGWQTIYIPGDAVYPEVHDLIASHIVLYKSECPRKCYRYDSKCDSKITVGMVIQERGMPFSQVKEYAEGFCEWLYGNKDG